MIMSNKDNIIDVLKKIDCPLINCDIENHDAMIKDLAEYLDNNNIIVNNIKDVTNKVTEEEIAEYFKHTWKLYPRKINKVLAYKSYCKKLKGLEKEEANKMAKTIYKFVAKNVKDWEDSNRDIEYIPHFSSLINANFVDNKKR